MIQMIKNVFHSGKFVVGFVLFCLVLLSCFYPLISEFSPMEQPGTAFHAPGTYVNLKDTIETKTTNLNYTGSAGIHGKFGDEEIAMMKRWLLSATELSEEQVDEALENDDAFLALWNKSYDSTIKPKGWIKADLNKVNSYDKIIKNLNSTAGVIIAGEGEDGTLEEKDVITSKEFVNISNIGNKTTFPLGTDNFGADVLTKLTSAILVSLRMGLLAGTIATLIGLTIGLLAGFLGGVVDNILTFFTNIFTVIPSFVILVLIANSISQAGRSPELVSLIIGVTAWPWTARSVRSQVISLRNRDHVNLSKLSGHSLPRIILQDILPYILSYVIMALILQVSSGIGAEAQLSMLGLGPSTTTTATLGLMMNWANTFSAAQNGQWWAFVPVVISITLISFSMNLMNTGLDQVFNPQLRD